MADENDQTASERQARDQDRAFEERQSNQAQAARRAQIKEGDEFAIAGHTRERGEDPDSALGDKNMTQSGAEPQPNPAEGRSE